MPRRAWESRPDTALPTPPVRPSLPPCDAVRHGQQQLRGTVPPTPVRPTRRTLEKGRRSPRRGDERILHARTGLHRSVRPVGAVTSVAISHVRPSLPSRRHPGHCITIPNAVEACGDRRHHAGYCASYNLTSTAPSRPHAGGHRTGDLYAATLKAAPGRAQDAP
jgi:hypothetical protein